MADQWLQKYLRESWTFPLGSMLNTYSSTIKGLDKSPKEIVEATEIFYLKSQELVKRSAKEAEGTKPKEPNLPL